MRKQTNIKNLTLYFIRHGKTFFNTTMQVQGNCDSFLTKIGEEQTLLTGQELKNITFAKVYCGDLGRHRQTIQIILKQNQNPVPETIEHYGLREWNFGGFEGRDDEAMWRPVFEKNGFSFDLEFTNFNKLNALLGDRGICEAIAANDTLQMVEKYDAILERIEKIIEKILEEMMYTENKNILIVTSGNILATMLYQLIPNSYGGENIENCSLTKLRYHQGKFELLKLAENNYLKEMRTT